MAARDKVWTKIADIPWLTAGGIDLGRVPIGSILLQAMSPDVDEFRSACSMLKALGHAGRSEAGVFLLGLIPRHADDCHRLTLVAEALDAFPTEASVTVLVSEFRRVKGSSATRGYLRRILATLFGFPTPLVQAQLESLASDPNIGVRFRRHIRSIIED